MEARVNLGKAVPELYKAVLQFEQIVSERTITGAVTKPFSHLLRLRASQLNGCAFCIRMHAQDAASSGESNDRITLLPAWRETEHYSEKERAALELMEAITLISEGRIADELYTRVSAILSPEEISAVEWIGVVINAWNRIAIASRYPVKP